MAAKVYFCYQILIALGAVATWAKYNYHAFRSINLDPPILTLVR